MLVSFNVVVMWSQGSSAVLKSCSRNLFQFFPNFQVLFQSCYCSFLQVVWSCDLRVQKLCSRHFLVIYFTFFPNLNFFCNFLLGVFFLIFILCREGFSWLRGQPRALPLRGAWGPAPRPPPLRGAFPSAQGSPINYCSIASAFLLFKVFATRPAQWVQLFHISRCSCNLFQFIPNFQVLFGSCSCYFPQVQWSCDLRVQVVCQVMFLEFISIFPQFSSAVQVMFWLFW